MQIGTNVVAFILMMLINFERSSTCYLRRPVCVVTGRWSCTTCTCSFQWNIVERAYRVQELGIYLKQVNCPAHWIILLKRVSWHMGLNIQHPHHEALSTAGVKPKKTLFWGKRILSCTFASFVPVTSRLHCSVAHSHWEVKLRCNPAHNLLANFQ